MSNVSKDLIGAAGVHYVVSKLSMRGIIALPTTRNTAGVDIIVSNKNGSSMALFQVKSSGKKVKFWPTSNEDRIMSGKNCYYAFLRYIEKDDDFEAFLVEGKEVRKQVAENAAYYKKKGRKEFAFFEIYKEDEAVYKKEWDVFSI
ncbi:MAG: hypothetical protein WC899_15565 [bacterium]